MANRVNSFNVQGNTYGIEADLTFDSSPTVGSSNPVTSDGIAQAIQSVTLGDSISYGRTDGTPVGYCSISYGTNNSAIGAYSVSIGDNNVNNCRCGITVGRVNQLFGYQTGVAIGDNNCIIGYSCVAIGLNGQIGSTVSTTIPSEPDYNAKVFIGYINISSKKIYYDPDMENQITVSLSTSESCYFVDKTEGQPNRSPGDVYRYKRTANYTYTLTKVVNEYVYLGDRCSTRLYVYRGPTYYDAANGKNYFHYDPTTHTFSDEVDSYSQPYRERPVTGHLYFDIISGNFIMYTGGNNITLKTIGNVARIDWLKVKVYKCDRDLWGSAPSPSITKNSRFSTPGIRAYIYTTVNGDRSKAYKVYSRPDYGDDCDITNTILDGQSVVDLSDETESAVSLKNAYYYCDVDGVPRLVRMGYNSTNDGFWYSGLNISGNCSTVFGSGSTTTGGGYGNIVSGTGCKVYGAAEGLAVFGLYNTVDIGPSFSGQNGSLVAGRSVSVTSRNDGTHTFCAIGGDISLEGDPFCTSDRWFVIGDNIQNTNKCAGIDNLLFGTYLYTGDISTAGIIGHNHNVYDIMYSYSYGYGHRINGLPTTILTKNISGIWEGEGVTYDANTGTYSFPQNKIFKLLGAKSGWEDTGAAGFDRSCTGFLGYAKSTDGTTLTSMGSGLSMTTGYLTAIGTMNYYNMDSDVSATDVTNCNYCTIIGYYNNVKYRSNYYGINVYGSSLDISGEINKCSMFLGAYNTMTGTTGAMFTVGIGTSSSAKKNGLVIFDSGVMAAPSSPDTITGGTDAMATTGLNSDKMVVTYGMMKDYTGPGGGGSSRPHVDTVTLATANWDGSTFEQTVSLTGMTAGAIVIVQPVGSPQQFNYHSVYLDSQDADELTFKCATTPSVDISVKVVYWP